MGERLERCIGERFEYEDQAGETHELVVVKNNGDVGCYGCFFCWTKEHTTDERCVRTDDDKKQTGECSFDDCCVYFASTHDVRRGEARKEYDAGGKDREIADKVVTALMNKIASFDMKWEVVEALAAARGEKAEDRALLPFPDCENEDEEEWDEEDEWDDEEEYEEE